LLEEAHAAHTRLKQLMDRRSRLMRGFSHDVKNPLGVADGYAALLGDGIYGTITAEQRHSLDRVRQAIQHALSLIEDVHELSRAETGHLAVHRGPTDIGALVLALADEYQATTLAKHLELIVDVERRLPIADTDAARIRQIVSNLLSNAIKYTERGSVVLRARSDVREDAADVVIEVADTGAGIAPEWQTLVFEEFSRIPGSNQPGAGLGLAISRRIAELLGCSIRIESELGHGSTFALRIPAGAGAVRAEDSTIPARSTTLPSRPPSRA
jgi:signal transduction histidine kinase